jgi:hypothetical protein
MVLTDGNVVLVSTMDTTLSSGCAGMSPFPACWPTALSASGVIPKRLNPAISWQTSSAPLGPSVRLIGSPRFWRGGAAAELRLRVCCSIAVDSHVLNYPAARLPENR